MFTRLKRVIFFVCASHGLLWMGCNQQASFSGEDTSADPVQEISSDNDIGTGGRDDIANDNDISSRGSDQIINDNDTSNDSDRITTNNDTSNDGDVQKCTTSDFVEVNWPQDVEQCHDSGRIYNFGLNDGNTSVRPGCSSVRESSYDCSFEGIRNAVSALELTSAENKVRNIEAGANGKQYRLVACGEAANGNIILNQFVDVRNATIDPVSCRIDPGSISVLTTCWRKYDGTQPPEPTSAAEVGKAVQDCLQAQ